MRTYRRLREVESGRVVVTRLEMAETAVGRAVGLLGRKGLEADAALWLEPCNGVHTFGLRFAIDVLFLDAQGKAIRLVPALRTWRICGPVRGARTVVELPAGTLATMGITLGRRYAAE